MYRRNRAYICSLDHPATWRASSVMHVCLAVARFRDGWGAIQPEPRGAGEGNNYARHVVQDFASEPKRTPPRQPEPSVQFDRAQGKGKAAAGKARSLGPTVDEVENVREPFVGVPEDAGSAGDVIPGLGLDRVQGDDRMRGNVGYPVSAPGVARQYNLVISVPVVSSLYGTFAS